jgi:hypothetical protein
MTIFAYIPRKSTEQKGTVLTGLQMMGKAGRAVSDLRELEPNCDDEQANEYNENEITVESILKSLNLSQYNLTSVPKNITSYTAVTELSFSRNSFGVIPESLFQMPSVRICRLDYNLISDLPSSLAGWSKLEELYLGYNHIEKLPSSISQLYHIKVLDLQHNRITEIAPEIGDLFSLRYLTLSHNQIASLPENLTLIIKLRYLHVDHNQLESFPSPTGCFKRLKQLKIKGNFKNELPQTLYDLRTVNKLVDIDVFDAASRLHLDETPALDTEKFRKKKTHKPPTVTRSTISRKLKPFLQQVQEAASSESAFSGINIANLKSKEDFGANPYATLRNVRSRSRSDAHSNPFLPVKPRPTLTPRADQKLQMIEPMPKSIKELGEIEYVVDREEPHVRLATIEQLVALLTYDTGISMKILIF